ncbi:MAG: AraC family ligand binding domain-containing protein, partial [Henriciella sp.]
MKRTFDIDLGRRPVVGLADEYPSGFTDPPHAHDRIQLLYASSGVMSVVTDETSFVIPPQRAVWIPSGVKHEVSCRGPVSLRSLYIDPKYERQDPDCHIVEVSQLLKALI